MEQSKLDQQVLTEEELLKLLGLTKKQLDHLRWNKGFPCVGLHRRARVYLADAVLEYIERQAREALYDKQRRALARWKDKSA